MSKILYRYEIQYKNWDDDTDIYLREYPVTRETEKCYFIEYNWKERRILKDAFNTYAFDNKEDAKNHLIRRTRKRIAWYEYWIEECKKALELVKSESKQ